MKMVAGMIPLQNAVVTTHYLSSFWRFLWPVGKVQFAVEVTLCNCYFCNTTHVNKALVCASIYIPFINIFYLRKMDSLPLYRLVQLLSTEQIFIFKLFFIQYNWKLEKMNDHCQHIRIIYLLQPCHMEDDGIFLP